MGIGRVSGAKLCDGVYGVYGMCDWVACFNFSISVVHTILNSTAS
jgi:hypothetical protein